MYQVHSGSWRLFSMLPNPERGRNYYSAKCGHLTGRNGWENFKKYLAENAVSPDGTKGIVELSLTIDMAAKVSKIEVTKT